MKRKMIEIFLLRVGGVPKLSFHMENTIHFLKTYWLKGREIEISLLNILPVDFSLHDDLTVLSKLQETFYQLVYSITVNLETSIMTSLSGDQQFWAAAQI